MLIKADELFTLSLHLNVDVLGNGIDILHY
jgi:hypothetical protein